MSVKKVGKLTVIGLIAGIILILVMKFIYLSTGNEAYVLLFNFDYIPGINTLKPVWLFGYIFHFITCIVSVIALYYLLSLGQFEKKIWPYVVVFTAGGGILFFLTGLSNEPPAATDFMAWFYWTFAHAIFSYCAGFLVKKWM